KGKKLSLKAKAKTYKGCKVVKHVGLRYQSSNTKIVKVTSKGTLKGIKKGKAKVWVYAQNGKYKTVDVTVK
ncbi:MAG: Ig-like domain-containing protein, partial [Firmicutes bacterium]|nr:Ig-like domain-containing protein [Bacillota bacterium]